MGRESRREFLQELRDYRELRHYQDLLRQFREASVQVHAYDGADRRPSAGDQQLAGADDDSAEAPRNHDDSPGHLLQDPRVRAIMETYLYNDDDFLRDDDADNEPASHDDDGDEFDGEYELEDSDDDDFQPFDIGSEDFIRFIETWSQGSHEEAYHFLSELVEPVVLEQFMEVMETDDFLEWVYEAVGDDGRSLLAQGTPARLDDESYGGFRGVVPASPAAVASLEKQKYQDLGDDHHNVCPICLEDYAPDDALSVMPCTYRHRYHQDCLAAWLECNHSCPLCRHALPTDDQDHEHGIQPYS